MEVCFSFSELLKCLVSNRKKKEYFGKKDLKTQKKIVFLKGIEFIIYYEIKIIPIEVPSDT